MIRRIPLRFLVPGLILVTGLLALSGLLYSEWRRTQHHIVDDMSRRVRILGMVLSGEVEAAIRMQQRGQLHTTIESLQADPDLIRAAVVGPHGRILSATRFRAVGEPLRESQFRDFTGLLEGPALDKGGLIRRVPGQRLRGVFPLRIREGEQALLPNSRGYLLLEYDLSRLAGVLSDNLVVRGLYSGAAIGAISLLLWAFFHYRLLRPVRRLSRLANRIGHGDFSARPSEEGGDELGQLGRELAAMARRLEHNTRELAYQALHDNLTGLLNRWGFEGHLESLLRRLDYDDDEHALIYLDIDQFRVINDTWGHTAGDAMTQQISRVLEKHVFVRDHLARLSGDEFALLLEDCSQADALAKAEKLRKAIEDFRFDWRGTALRITASLGVVPIRSGMDRMEQLFSLADTACYAAKEAGRNRVQLLQEGDEELERRHGEMRWVNRIQSALEEDRFRLHAQPIVNLGTRPDGIPRYEVLVRMLDEEGDLIPPGEFLTAAERYHLAASIDRWVIERTVRELAAHPRHLRELDFCAINLSGLSLNDPGLSDFIDGVFRAREPSLPGKLCFEITETAAITHLGRATELIARVQQWGCRFALDDFGSGVSSFGYLKNLPVDLIKIDGMFVRDILEDPVNRALVRAVNDISHEMGKRTVAEFVESEAIRKEMERIGVDFAQGFGIEPPKPLEELLGPRGSQAAP